MFAVIFVVQPKPERWDAYLDLAKFLKPKLEAIDGFIDNERFESKRTAGLLLSLSTWRDEKSVVRWRIQGEHHEVQQKGRFEIFDDYRLRVGEIIHDSDPPAGLTIVQQRLDGTETGTAKVATITELTPETKGAPAGSPDRQPPRLSLAPPRDGLVDAEVFESIYHPGKLLLLGLWQDVDAAASWRPAQGAPAGKLRHRRVRVIRDYGMFDRREAPQYYPTVEPPRRPAAD
jgi:heme-degrading monooxygenase HmoA